MPRNEPDKSSKWLIQHQGDSMLRLGGLPRIHRWRPHQAEIVQPAKLPDGLLEVWFDGAKKKEYVLLEIAAYSEKRYLQQAIDDLVIAYEFLGVLPELLMLVLAPKGRFRVSGIHDVESRRKLSRITAKWKVVEMWTVEAEDLFAADDVGLVPWIPLTRFDDPPDVVFERCRERIEKNAPPEHKEQFQVVSQVLASLRYNDEELISLLGGIEGMSVFPLLNKIEKAAEQKTKHEWLLRVLNTRFGEVPDDVAARIRRFRSEKKLNSLLDFAVECKTLEAFQSRLHS